MIRRMAKSSDDTLFRLVVMAGVIGFGVWAAVKYTTLPKLLIHRGIAWYEVQFAPKTLPTENTTSPPDIAYSATPPRELPPTVQPPLPIKQYQPERHANGGTFGQPVKRVQYETEPENLASQSLMAEMDANDFDQRSAIELRLRQLGAVYSLLEMWGRDETRYRFHCRVALAGGATTTRNFEAVGANPSIVMQQVLKEVEAWRSLETPLDSGLPQHGLP